MKINPELILAGTSLGAFWANYFGQIYGLRIVIINPALHSSVTLKNYIGIIKNFNSGEERKFTEADADCYRKYETEIMPGISRTIVPGTKDDHIDDMETEKAFRGKGRLFLPTKDKNRKLSEDRYRISKVSINFKKYDRFYRRHSRLCG